MSSFHPFLDGRVPQQALGAAGPPSVASTPARRHTVRFATIALAGLVLGSTPGRLPAGTIAWGSAQTIAGDSDVVTTGTLVYAYDFGQAVSATTTLNGVPFVPFNVVTPTFGPVTVGSVTLLETESGTGKTLVGYDYFGFGSTPYVNLSAGYQTLLDTGVNSLVPEAISVTLGGLQVGQVYTVQWWSSDAAFQYDAFTAASGSPTVTLDSNTTAVPGGVGQFAVGTFTASSVSETFLLTGSDGTQPGVGFPLINALQLRTQAGPGPTPVPEIDGTTLPAVLSLLGGTFAILDHRRRRSAPLAT